MRLASALAVIPAAWLARTRHAGGVIGTAWIGDASIPVRR